jgi:hypothetical protein
MVETKPKMRKYKWFWAWQDDKREKWLTEMSLQGWHLDSIDRIGLGFNFIKGEPGNFTYQLDFRAGKDHEINDFLAFAIDAGWEHIESYTGWHYFRKPTTPEDAEEFFSDSDSKLGKYKRLRATLPLLYPFYFVVFIPHLDKYPLWFAILFVTVIVLLIISVSISLIGVTKRINALEAQARF